MSPPEVVDPHRIALTLGHRVKAHDDAARLASTDRKDSRAQESMAHPLHECRIAALPDDVLVDAPCLVGAHRLPGHELAVDLELQSFERGVLRKRKEIVRLADSTAPVDEGLFDLIVQHAVAQLDLDVAGPSLDVGDWNPPAFAPWTPRT